MIVLQKMMTRATMQNCTLGWSLVRKETAAPMMHMIPTLYTLIPMYLLSLRAGMLTLRVSHAKKQPNNWNGGQEGERVITRQRALSLLGKLQELQVATSCLHLWPHVAS